MSIDVRRIAISHSQLTDRTVYIITGSQSPPLVTLADKSGGLAVSQVFSRGQTFDSLPGDPRGIRIIFEGSGFNSGEVAVNIFQPNATTENWEVIKPN